MYLSSKIEKLHAVSEITFGLSHVNSRKWWTEVEGIAIMPLICEGSVPGPPPQEALTPPTGLVFPDKASTVLLSGSQLLQLKSLVLTVCLHNCVPIRQ